MHIKTATPPDSDDVGRLVASLLEELDGASLSEADRSVIIARSRDMIRDRTVVAFLAIDGNEPVGVATLSERSAIYAGRFGEVTELYVQPRYRASGVGAELLSACVDYAEKSQWTRLEVATPELPKWRRSAQFYARHGFITVGDRMKLEFAGASTDGK